MLSEEEAEAKIEPYLSNTANLGAITDFKGYWIFPINDPNDAFDNFYAVDQKSGEVKRFNPAFDGGEEYFKEAERQNG